MDKCLKMELKKEAKSANQLSSQLGFNDEDAIL